MSQATIVTAVSFNPIEGGARTDGLIGSARVTIAGLVIDGIAVRRDRDGDLALSFPQRPRTRGRRYHVVRPVNDNARIAIEQAVFAKIDLYGKSADA